MPPMINRLIWEKCVSKRWCVKIKFPKFERCWQLDGCVRVVEEGGTFFLELQLEGIRKRFDIANACVSLPAPPFELKVCVADIEVSDGRPVSFSIVVQGCIGVDLPRPLPDLRECVTLYAAKISLPSLSLREALRLQLIDEVDALGSEEELTLVMEADLSAARVDSILRLSAYAGDDAHVESRGSATMFQPVLQLLNPGTREQLLVADVETPDNGYVAKRVVKGKTPPGIAVAGSVYPVILELEREARPIYLPVVTWVRLLAPRLTLDPKVHSQITAFVMLNGSVMGRASIDTSTDAAVDEEAAASFAKQAFDQYSATNKKYEIG